MRIDISSCPYCGQTEFIEARQYAPEAYIAGETLFGQQLRHTVCRHCGSVVRSYVEEPELLLKKKNRRIKG